VVVLRATKRVMQRLPPSAAVAPGRCDTALGDWYVNRFVVDRQPLRILVNSTSLLSILMPARDLRTLPERLPALVADRLQRLRIEFALVDVEIRAMAPVTVAPTVDRAVLGCLVDYVKTVPFHLDAGAWDLTALPFVEARLAETPCHLGRAMIWPARTAPELLAARWTAGAPT
jgi:hypothetical protein